MCPVCGLKFWGTISAHVCSRECNAKRRIRLTEQRKADETYMKNRKFDTVIARMKTFCENDAREKFENGTLDARLANLWMGHNYGYAQKQETTVSANGAEDDPLSAALKKLAEDG